MKDYASIEALLEGTEGTSIHIECGASASEDILKALRVKFGDTRRCAFMLSEDRGFERETVRSYLGRLANRGMSIDVAVVHFGLGAVASKRLKVLSKNERALLEFARMSLMDPEVCFCERPLGDLDAKARKAALTWISEMIDKGTTFITTAEPLREAMLMPGLVFWFDEGHFIAADIEHDDADGSATAGGASALGADGSFVGDEVNVCKIAVKTENATLLLDPKDIDFIESMSKANYVSVRGSLYQTNLTMDELEVELVRFGFFRCHRSYIVNAQKVSKVERYTRNSFNLTLNDVAESSIPLAKGRAEEMRTRYGW
ncbi:MAG: LytTR family transcriptional regulator DNA-binding domain-containing protein [Raoultibacter sp.]